MRIAMLTNNYKPFVGGVPISIERLSEGLRALGHEVFIFAPSYDNQVEEEGVIRYKSFNKMNAKGKFVVPNPFDLSIEKKFKELNIDIIHVHHPMLIGWVGLYLSKKYNIPTVFTYHTRYEQYLHNIKAFKKVEEYSLSDDMFIRKELSNSVLDFSKEIVIPYGVKVFSNKCDVVFAPTGLIKEYLEDMDVKSHVTVLPTGLDKKSLESKSNKYKEIRKKYIGDKEFLFCTVSRLSKEKNIEFIIKGLKSLKDKNGENFKTLIIGDGPLKGKLELMVLKLGLKDLVEFVPCIPNEEIMDYYKACDMFLFASKSETQGIVLLEAMGAKNPVIAVKGTGVVDIVKDGFNGYMSNEDVNQWSDLIVKVINDKDGMERLKYGAYETALKYSNERIAKLAESNYEWAIRLQCRRNREYSFQ